MPGKTKTALAALFILGPASVVVLAGPNNRTDNHGSVRTVLLTMSHGRTGVVNHAAKPFAAEEKPWFAPPQLALVHNAPFCLKSASGTANCSYHTLILCEQARHPNSLDQCVPRFQACG
jgi:hypothetical protein